MSRMATELVVIAREMLAKATPENLMRADSNIYSISSYVEDELRRDGIDFRDVHIGQPMGSIHEVNIRVQLRRRNQYDEDRVSVFNACYAGFNKWAAKFGVGDVGYKQVGVYPRELGIWIQYD
jgi:hypothetical protein